MSDSFGLEGVRILGTSETYLEIEHDAELTTAVACPTCRTAQFVRHQGTRQVITDTPARGKKVRLAIARTRYKCKSCGGTFMQAWPPSIEPTAKATVRLLRYVEAEGCRHTIKGIARDVGLSETRVEGLVRGLAHRLYHHHRFPTPVVLGMDDLRLRKRLYTVLTDGATGRAIALVEGGKESAVVKELNRRKFDRTAVEIFVSDLGTTNLAVKKRMFPAALHVADKWHVLKGAQEALSKVINQEVNRLRKAGLSAQAKSIVAVKSLLMKGRVDRSGNAIQLQLNLSRLAPILISLPRIGKAFWAKIRLHRLYASADAREAIGHGIRFARRAMAKMIKTEFEAVLNRLYRHRQLVLNYFHARDPNGNLKHPTTGPTERRNGDIRATWRAGRGIYNLDYLSMRALYQPLMMHGEIVLCASCDAVMGPFGKHRLARPVTDPARARCPTCPPAP
ncbi:transposase [Qipengyuania citrea]|uniref:transposase n=1 Tax=Qipengyuania citrea TaxID=225971 RepID=UPI001E620021|nr:transposase [Qipengyuania citrea]MCD1589686.1 transposase [Qipengyuania citrea]